MSGFLHQLASRSLGLAPQVKSRAALPYAAPTADFSMVEAVSQKTTPAIERPGFEPPHNTRRNEQATEHTQPAPIFTENTDRAARSEAQTPTASQLPDIAGQQSPLHAPPNIEPIRQLLPPDINTIASPLRVERKPVSQQVERRPQDTPQAENTPPAFTDLESLVTRLLGDTPRQPETAQENTEQAAVITLHPATLRPETISPICPPSTRERPTITPEPDSAPEVHITIGRLEVNPPSRPAPAAQPPRPRGPAPLSLSDYLARRNGGRS